MSDAGDNGAYNNGNRAFLQAIMARGTMTLEEGKDVLAAIFSVEQGKRNPTTYRTNQADNRKAEESKRKTLQTKISLPTFQLPKMPSHPSTTKLPLPSIKSRNFDPGRS